MLSKFAVIVESCLIELAAISAVSLLESDLCSRINGVFIDAVYAFFSVVSVESHRLAEVFLNAVVIVECATEVSIEALYPCDVPVEVSCKC